jgi:hypothetical protein
VGEWPRPFGPVVALVLGVAEVETRRVGDEADALAVTGGRAGVVALTAARDGREVRVLPVAAGCGFAPAWCPSAPGQPGTAADPAVVKPATIAARTASTIAVPAIAAIRTRRRRRPDRSTKTGSMITCSCRGDSE